MVVFGQKRLISALVAASFLLLLAIAIGRGVVETQSLDVGTGPLLLLTAGLLAAAAVMFIGPVACVVAIPTLAVAKFLPTVAMGRVDVTAGDAFYVGLVVWTVVEFLKPGGVRRGAPSLSPTPILLFLGFAGLSVAYVAVAAPDAFGQSFISWVRLTQTLSIAFLASVFLKTPRDVKLVFAAVAIATMVTVAIGSTGHLTGGGADELANPERAGAGVLGPNVLGLISGMLVLMAFLGAFGRRILYRIPLVAVGVIGLVTAESVGSLVGTGVALTLGLVLMAPERRSVPGMRAVMAVTALVIGLALAYTVAAVVRPGNVPTSDAFKGGSAYHRTVVGSAGIELAKRHPLIGVGWRRSSDPGVLGDPEIARVLRARFPDAKPEFFPDVRTASVHNSYIQIGAELGVIGLALLAFVFFAFARDARRLIRRAPPGSDARRLLWFMSWCVVLILVWLNDNPLYGGQTETVLLATLIAAIAGLGRAGVGAPAQAEAR
jgi:O-antigen ligase